MGISPEGSTELKWSITSCLTKRITKDFGYSPKINPNMEKSVKEKTRRLSEPGTGSSTVGIVQDCGRHHLSDPTHNPPFSPILVCPPNRPRPLFTNSGTDMTNPDIYSRRPPPSPDLACSPNRPYLMNTGIDMTKTSPLSAAACRCLRLR